MTELREELNRIIKQGRQALLENNLDLTVHSFERAAQIAHKLSLNSIIGISYSYLALALGKKGHPEAALEHINTATEFFPMTPVNPLAYSSVLLGLGIEFQKIKLFECSIIILKNALTMARSKVAEVNLEAISIVARNLAFSYSKIGNNISSAKLFRIAADLEDEAHVAINLYRNSAYLYYQEEMKEFTLDILQTAFDKAGIIKDTNTQMEIARFQALVSYEIAVNYLQRSYLEKAIACLDLCIEKYTFTENSFWIIKAQYEKAMILERLGKIWQRNKSLKKIIQFKIDTNTEEYIIKSILLLTIHALEGEHYSEAEYYINQVSKQQMGELKLELSKKILEIRELLEISRKRGLIQADLRFSRKALDLPIEELLPEVKIPSQESPIKQEDVVSLQIPKLEISAPESSAVTELKSPSIEVLQELFDSSEETPPLLIRQEPLYTETQETKSVELPQDSESIITPKPTYEHDQEKAMALERLFRAHQLPQESTTLTSSITSIPPHEPTEVEYTAFEEPITQPIENFHQEIDFTPPVTFQDENVRTEVVGRLQRAGWAVELNFTNLTERGSEPDIIATKGLIRKSRKLIFFAENPADAEICSFLLQSNPDRGEKIIFLVNGDPREVNVSVMVKLVTQIDQLF
ncbi:MAG: hypothetical protein ACFFB5_02505 [Promethearchaeota archaeon]